MLTNLHMNIKAPEIITMKPGTDPYTVFSDVYAFSMYFFSARMYVCVLCLVFIILIFPPKNRHQASLCGSCSHGSCLTRTDPQFRFKLFFAA